MPTTAQRRWCIPWAIDYFLHQTYENCELVVVSDGPDSIEDLIPRHPRIHHFDLGDARPLGQKYNDCVSIARGPWVALWADDDWHAPRRLEYTMDRLLSHPDREIAGLRKMFFHKRGTTTTWFYQYPNDDDPYFLGGSIVFHKNYWRRHGFDSSRKQHADSSFTNAISHEEYHRVACVLNDPTFYVAINHDDNTGRRLDPTPDQRWSIWEGDLADIMGLTAARYLPETVHGPSPDRV